MRAALTCNGNVAKRWEQLGDCIHATGCRDSGSGCDVVWDDPLRYKWASLVSQYSHGLCNADPPEPPSPPPGPPWGWCEQLQASHSWSPDQQHQIANSLSSLLGAVLGGHALTTTGAHDSILHKLCSCWMLLTGLGSALHHWWPHSPWSHAVDLIPMNLLIMHSLVYVLVVAAALLIGRGPKRSHTYSLIVLIVALLATLFLLSYALRFHDVEEDAFNYSVMYAPMSMVLLGGTVLAHGIIVVQLLREWRSNSGKHGDVDVLLRVYATATISVFLICLPAQFIEYPRCPDWLFESGVSVHCLFHLGIFYAVFQANNALLALENRPVAAWRSCGWCGPCGRAGWPLFRVHVVVHEGEVDEKKGAPREEYSAAAQGSRGEEVGV